jgi:peptide deformylase
VAVRDVALIGDRILRQVARDLEPDDIRSPAVRSLVQDMIDTMHELGGIGIAAPQVSESIQLAVIEIPETSDRYPDMTPLPLTVFVNPRITIMDHTEQALWEGCLSVPDLRGLVPRPREVLVEFQDLQGLPQSIKARDFLASAVQHELDHLQGFLFIDRVRDTTKIATLENFRRFWLDNPADEIDA